MISKFRGKAVEGGGRGTKVLRYKRIQNGGSKKKSKKQYFRDYCKLWIWPNSIREKGDIFTQIEIRWGSVGVSFFRSSPEREPAHTGFHLRCNRHQEGEEKAKFAPQDFRMKVKNRSIFNDRDAKI